MDEHGRIVSFLLMLPERPPGHGLGNTSQRESDMTMQKPTSARRAQPLPNEQKQAVADGVESILSVTEEDIADYTESVVPEAKRRSNFRMLAQFLSMQAVFGTVLVGYGARFQGLTLFRARRRNVNRGRCHEHLFIGSANAGAVPVRPIR